MDPTPPKLQLPSTAQDLVLFKAQETIRRLQEELNATNQDVLLLTLDLDERVAERTAQLTKAVTSLKKEVAERRKAESEVRKLNDDLSRRADELEAFSYSVSHDLRAPLRHIGSYVQFLTEDAADRLNDEDCEMLARISHSVRRMGKLIDDLLEFARMARRQPVSATMNLNRMVRSIIDSFETELSGRSVKWVVASFPQVSGDEDMIALVLHNLISNAIKFSRNREKARIEVGYSEEEGEMTVFVKDNGAGFDPTHTDRLFRVFHRLHSEREFEGTGIGLANVHRIVQRHGGRVWAEGATGEGATFYFTLSMAGI